MTTLTFRKENEVKLGYKPRIPEEVWTDYKEVITSLHDAKTCRQEILRELQDQYVFPPSLGQLNSQMRKWGLNVYRSRGARQVKGGTARHLLKPTMETQQDLPNEELLFPTRHTDDALNHTGADDTPRSAWISPSHSQFGADAVGASVSTDSTVVSNAPARLFQVVPAVEDLFLSSTVTIESVTIDLEEVSQNAGTVADSAHQTPKLNIIIPMKTACMNWAIDDMGVHTPVWNIDTEEILREDPMDTGDTISELPTKSHISSLRSDTSSVREFKGFTYGPKLSGRVSVSARSQGSAMSIDSRESWDFSRVTGMPNHKHAIEEIEEEAIDATRFSFSGPSVFSSKPPDIPEKSDQDDPLSKPKTPSHQSHSWSHLYEDISLAGVHFI